MNVKKFARIGGIIMLIMGVVSLIPGLEGSTVALPVLKVTNSYGLFLGLFPMNFFNKVALILFGISGVAVSGQVDPHYSVTYSKVVFFVMGAVAILGIFPQTNTLGGYWPLFGAEVLTHGIFALLGGYFGFMEASTRHRSLHA